MLKTNRFLAVILLVLLVVSIGSYIGCGGSGSGDSGGSTTTEYFTLTVDKFGDGVVVSDVPGINYGDDNSESYPAGTTIVLTATADSGSQFNSCAGCDSISGNTCIVTMDSNKTVFVTFALIKMEFQPTTKILDDATMQNLVRQEDNIYCFDSQALDVSTLQVGDVIASSSGEGLLRRVTAISTSTDGLIMVETTDATLEDAIEEGTIAFTKKLGSAELTSSKALIKGVSLRAATEEATDFTIDINSLIYDDDGDENTTYDQIKVIGSTTINFEPDFAISFGLSGIKEFKSVLITENKQSLSVVAGSSIPFIDIKEPIKTFYFTPIPVCALVVIVPEITIYVGIKGEAGGTLSAEVTMETTCTAGIYYKKGEGWRGVYACPCNFWPDPLNVSSNASIKGYVSPEFKLLINDVVGPFASMEGYLKVEANASGSSLWWKLYGGMGASAGAKIEILSWTLAEYNVSLFNAEWELASSDTGDITDITSPTTPSGLSATTVSTSQINLSWDVSTDNIGIAGYNIYRNGIFIHPVTTTEFFDTERSPDTQYCYTVSAYDDAGNESEQSTQMCASTNTASDTTPPSDPTNLTVNAVSSSQINLSWGASTDNVRVAGYKIYRNGIPIKSVTTSSTSDTGLSLSTEYCYTVSAYDGTGNESGQSNEVCATTASTPPPTLWTRQMGSSEDDHAYGVAVDSNGNAYVAGWTLGDLDGNTSAGGYDIVVVKYDTDGNKLWTRQMGSSLDDYGRSVAVDSYGNAYVAGYTYGDLDGNTSAGGHDFFIVKYDTDGNKLWTRQMGSSLDDYAYGVAMDSSGNAYVSGYTEGGLDGNISAGNQDIFIVKYDTDGNKLWTRQMGTSGGDAAYGVTIDSGNVYVAGKTSGELDGNTNTGNADIFIVKYDTNGNKLWTRQMGSLSWDIAHSVAVDSSGNAYVTGRTYGEFDGNANAGGTDLFIVKYDTNGNKLWTKQMGSSTEDYAHSVAVDSSGNAYVTGRTYGGLDGNTNAGNGDLFIVKYDTNGNKLWTKQMGSSTEDHAYGAGVDSSGNAYVAGHTYGELDGNTNAGSSDLFLMKLGSGGGSGGDLL